MSQAKQTILVAGATGNTGREVCKTLSESFPNGEYRLLALTRSKTSDAAKALSDFKGVEVEEMDWSDIVCDWLKERNVIRAFIAPAIGPPQFLDESQFHLACLQAGVEYVVRTSTTACVVKIDSPVFYGRTHAAIENILDSPQYKNLAFTSLQPAIFHSFFSASGVDWIKHYKKTGEKKLLKITSDEHVGVAVIEPADVGRIAGLLLAQKDFTPYNGAKLVLGGPEDVTGADVKQLVEKFAGTTVDQVEYKNAEWLEALGNPPKYTRSLFFSVKTLWDGLVSKKNMPTSQQAIDLAAPKGTLEQAMREMLEQ